MKEQLAKIKTEALAAFEAVASPAAPVRKVTSAQGSPPPWTSCGSNIWARRGS